MTPTHRRVLLAVGLAALLVLAGCAGGSGGDGAPDSGGAAMTTTAGDAVTEETRTESAGDGSSSGGAAFDPEDARQRNRIRTGTATVRVASFDAAASNLTTAARDLGGFVANSERRRHRRENATWVTGRLVLRVPSGEFSTLRERVAAQGTVVHSESSVEDVTGQIVDLQARLENLRAQRDRLRRLYDAANETEDVLAVGRRLSDTQEEIERLEGRLASLEDRVAFSTLTVTLDEPEPEVEEPTTTDRTAWYETSVLAAFLDSVSGVATTLRMLVVAAAYLAPFAAVFGTPVVGFVAWRRWRSGDPDVDVDPDVAVAASDAPAAGSAAADERSAGVGSPGGVGATDESAGEGAPSNGPAGDEVTTDENGSGGDDRTAAEDGPE